MNVLRRLLGERACQPIDGDVYVQGGYVPRRSSVPSEGGVEMLARFADSCWRDNIQHQTTILRQEELLMSQAERITRQKQRMARLRTDRDRLRAELERRAKGPSA